jgi:ubiquinone biosynthesis protein UbiJ
MGVLFEPTGADYAMHEARQAAEEIRQLKKIVADLTRRIEILEKQEKK